MRHPSLQTGRKLAKLARGTMFSVTESCRSHPIVVPHDRPSPLLAVSPLSLTLAAPRANIIRVPSRRESNAISPTRALARVPRTHDDTRARERSCEKFKCVLGRLARVDGRCLNIQSLFPRALCARIVLLPYRGGGKRSEIITI